MVLAIESVEEVANLIFLPGLSTKDEATDISGRGIGMDAVREYIEDCGGSIQLELGVSTGTEKIPVTFVLTLPKENQAYELDLAGIVA